MATTKKDRRRAYVQAQTVEKLAIPGAKATVRTIENVRKVAIKAFKQDTDVPQAIRDELFKLQPILRDAMLNAHLAAVAVSQGKKAKVLSTVYTQSINFLMELLELTPDEIDDLGRQYDTTAFEILETNQQNVAEAVRQTIADSIINQLPVQDAIEEIQKTFFNTGWSPANPYIVETLYRTNTQLAYSAGNYQATRLDPDIDEILWGYKYVTVGDNRVREEHAAMEGMTLPKNDPRWGVLWPPNGWNCRCQTIAIFEERQIQEPKPNAKPDEGFAFNPGLVFQP